MALNVISLNDYHSIFDTQSLLPFTEVCLGYGYKQELLTLETL